jgi:membrane protease YdiL (CAAX protease family)
MQRLMGVVRSMWVKEHSYPQSSKARAVLILLCLSAGCLIMAAGMYVQLLLPIVPVGLLYCIQVAVVVGFMVLALMLYRNTLLRKYWRLAFAYFVAASAIMLSNFLADWAVIISGYSVESARGFTVLKLAEDTIIVATVVGFVLLIRDDPKELFLTRGRLWPGLCIGLAVFLVLTAFSYYSAMSKIEDPGMGRKVFLACGLMSLADGFMEELLFRGLFLKRLARYIGDDWANFVTALVFAFAHQIFLETPMFMLNAFVFGLILGWVMQKTGSLWASALLHAGILMVTMEGFLERFFGIVF